VEPGADRGPRCPVCGGALRVTREEMVRGLPGVFDVRQRCDRCGESTHGVWVAPHAWH
jgi:hypothetical protein